MNLKWAALHLNIYRASDLFYVFIFIYIYICLHEIGDDNNSNYELGLFFIFIFKNDKKYYDYFLYTFFKIKNNIKQGVIFITIVENILIN